MLEAKGHALRRKTNKDSKVHLKRNCDYNSIYLSRCYNSPLLCISYHAITYPKNKIERKVALPSAMNFLGKPTKGKYKYLTGP